MKENKLASMFIVFVIICSCHVYSAKVSIKEENVKFTDLPEERQKKENKIAEYFDNAWNISVSRNNQGSRIINIPLDVKSKIDDKIFSYIKAAKALKVDKNDTQSIERSFRKWEEIFLMIFNEAGYSCDSLFTLKIDRNALRIFGEKWWENIIEEDRIVFFNEYYNSIEIRGTEAGITFSQKQVKGIKLVTVKYTNPIITAKDPKITFKEALQSISNKLNIVIKGQRPKKELCYVQKTGSHVTALSLCWKIHLDYTNNVKDPICVYINTINGEIVAEDAISDYMK
jgi:hypothetical protein